jgi:lipid-A-disaccharide synthase
MRAVREYVSHMMVIFPFEEAFYREAGVRATFVGHPLVELVRPAADPRAFLASQGLDPARPVVALLPGSRRQEIAYNLPPIAGALRLLRQQRPDLQAALAVAPESTEPRSTRASASSRRTRHRQAHALLSAATAGIVASGTATVEVALLDLPSVVVYRLSPLSYALGRPFVHVPHYAMANLIAERARAHRAHPGRVPAGHRGARWAPCWTTRSGEPRSRTARRGPTEARRTGRLGPGRRGRPALPGDIGKKILTG